MSANRRTGADPYADTRGEAARTRPPLIRLRRREINVLSAAGAMLEGPLTRKVANHMRLWVDKAGTGACTLTWRAAAPAAGEYELSALSAGDRPYRLEVACGGVAVRRLVRKEGWQRVPLGRLALKKGRNTIALRSASRQFRISSLELVLPEARERIAAEAEALRGDADWFRRAGYGVMFQWCNRTTPRRGGVKLWRRKVRDFDLGALLRTVEQTGAAYVLWSMTWGQQYISAPIAALDAIVPGRTTRRDLLGELADGLCERGIRLILYYHYGYDCYHSTDRAWMEASGGHEADKSRLLDNCRAIVREVARRYGRKLHGWFFDGGQRCYDCHFDDSPYVGIPTAPFRRLTRAAKEGNPRRIVCYNPWILPSLTPFEDYFCGEGLRRFAGLKGGVFRSGP
jgi:hypothetical protein